MVEGAFESLAASFFDFAVDMGELCAVADWDPGDFVLDAPCALDSEADVDLGWVATAADMSARQERGDEASSSCGG